MSQAVRAIAVAFLIVISWRTVRAAQLDLTILPRFNNAPLVFDTVTNQTAAGQRISVTRLDFLISDISLRRENGNWVGLPNRFAYISAREGRTHFTLENMPAGTFDHFRFQIGVPPIINHADSARWPGGHPLNPDVNHLYWGWSHEYVFLAFEGAWQNGGKQSGFSYHLATDPQLMTVVLPVQLNSLSNQSLQLPLEVDKFLSGANAIQLSDATETTHSRVNDLLAGQLGRHVESAFSISVGQASSLSLISEKMETGKMPVLQSLIAPGATPYRFTISKSFPTPDLPRDNPLTVEGVALGSRLFFDRRLSANNSESCATCHQPRIGLTEHRRFSRGIGGELGTRNSMPLENLAWKKDFFWDGRAASLREQVLQPIQNPIEMHQPLALLLRKLAADPDEHRLFANAFGSAESTTEVVKITAGSIHTLVVLDAAQTLGV